MKSKLLRLLLISILAAVGLELTIFNIKAYKSLFYPKTIRYSHDAITSKNTYDDNQGIRVSIVDGNSYEINDINANVYNVYIDGESNKYTKIDILLMDEGNKEYYEAGTIYYKTSNYQSRSFEIHPTGKLLGIKLKIESSGLSKINNIFLNKTVHININCCRVLIFFAIFYLILSNHYFHFFNECFSKKKYKYITVLIITIINLFLTFLVFNAKESNYLIDGENYNQHNQYQLLSRALSKGKLSLDLKPTDKLLSLDNPYDRWHRDKSLIINEDYYWDYAYYNGKYYSYFGVVPCVLTYLPYHMLTGKDLNNNIALSICLIIYTIGAFYLTYQLFAKYFNNSTYKKYLLSSLVISLLSGMAFLTYRSYFYNIPISLASAFCMLGLGFWIKSSNNEKVNTKYLLLGSIFMALVAGCRPQVFLASILGIPIFWKHIKTRDCFKLKNILSLLIPMAVIAYFLMRYNYLRFGSVFDFGANYNLTTNDMTKRGFVFARIFPGLYSYLFEFPHISSQFPFVIQHQIVTSYIGVTISEYMFCGLFFMSLLNFVILLIFSLRKDLKSQKTYVLSIMAIIVGLLIMIIDTEVAGIVPRYMPDFGFLFSISSVLIWMTILEKYNSKVLMKTFTTLIIISIIFNFFIYFTDVHREYAPYYIEIYYFIKYLISFWL